MQARTNALRRERRRGHRECRRGRAPAAAARSSAARSSSRNVDIAQRVHADDPRAARLSGELEDHHDLRPAAPRHAEPEAVDPGRGSVSCSISTWRLRPPRPCPPASASKPTTGPRRPAARRSTCCSRRSPAPRRRRAERPGPRPPCPVRAPRSPRLTRRPRLFQARPKGRRPGRATRPPARLPRPRRTSRREARRSPPCSAAF